MALRAQILSPVTDVGSDLGQLLPFKDADFAFLSKCFTAILTLEYLVWWCFVCCFFVVVFFNYYYFVLFFFISVLPCHTWLMVPPGLLPPGCPEAADGQRHMAGVCPWQRGACHLMDTSLLCTCSWIRAALHCKPAAGCVETLVRKPRNMITVEMFVFMTASGVKWTCH